MNITCIAFSGTDLGQIIGEFVDEGMSGDEGELDTKDENIELSHQPLAVALWISAANMPKNMPNWFGPLNKNEPTAVRIALHIQARLINPLLPTRHWWRAYHFEPRFREF